MRKLCGFLVTLTILWMHGHCAEAADKIRISVTNPNMSFLPSGVALKKGFFKDEGLDVEIIRMNVPNIITALVTGDIGYTLIFGSVVRGALRGMPMRALASLLDGSTHALVARPEYKSGKDLKGKTVGIGANLKTIKDKPDEVKKVVKAMVRANRFIREDKEGAVRILMEWGKVERDHAAAAYDSTWKVFSSDGSIPQEGLRLVIEQAKAELKLNRDVTLDEVVDFGPLRQAQKELGLRK